MPQSETRGNFSFQGNFLKIQRTRLIMMLISAADFEKGRRNIATSTKASMKNQEMADSRGFSTRGESFIGR